MLTKLKLKKKKSGALNAKYWYEGTMLLKV